MAAENSVIKKEIVYAENLCRELESQIENLEKRLQNVQNDTLLQKTGNKHAIVTELEEMQKLLKKYRDQLEHLKTHNSRPLKLIMALTLVIFIVWMIVVLTNNWGKHTTDSNNNNNNNNNSNNGAS